MTKNCWLKTETLLEKNIHTVQVGSTLIFIIIPIQQKNTSGQYFASFICQQPDSIWSLLFFWDNNTVSKRCCIQRREKSRATYVILCARYDKYFYFCSAKDTHLMHLYLSWLFSTEEKPRHIHSMGIYVYGYILKCKWFTRVNHALHSICIRNFSHRYKSLITIWTLIVK